MLFYTVLFYFKLCVYVCPLVSLKPPLYLSLPSRSCHSDLSDGFCFVVCRCLSGEGGQGGAAGRGAEPPAEQPAAAGGVAEHSGSPHQSHRAAVQRQQALLASARANHTQISRKMQIVPRACTLSAPVLCECMRCQRQMHAHVVQSACGRGLNPESCTCLLVREYANQPVRKKEMTFPTSPDLHRLTMPECSSWCI